MGIRTGTHLRLGKMIWVYYTLGRPFKAGNGHNQLTPPCEAKAPTRDLDRFTPPHPIVDGTWRLGTLANIDGGMV